MIFTPTEISDVVEIEPDVFGDQRGFFMETWQVKKYVEAGIDATFVQDNHSRSTQGILRGCITRPVTPRENWYVS